MFKVGLGGVNPFVSIVNFNGKSKPGSLLDECLESILQTDYPSFKILFVDNGSTDGSV